MSKNHFAPAPSAPAMASRTGPDPATALSARTRATRMALFELKYTFRQRVVYMYLLTGPVLGLLMALFSKTELFAKADERKVWGVVAGVSLPILVTICVSGAVATVIAERRQTQLFKVLRTTELGAAQMMTALTVPYIAVATATGAIIVIGWPLLGAPSTDHWALAALGVLGMALLAVLGGVTVGSLSRDASAVSYTVIAIAVVAGAGPALALGSIWTDTFNSYMLLAPFAGVGDLLARGVGADLVDAPAGLPIVLVDVLTTLVWAGAAVWIAIRTWRWEPRD